ncbi:hypothetical protein RF11_03523 [Thelohanellus kitauei]|uniref:Uncharacterized protein n=1 Tax=Thelohanellus kitauei TaxID=669202 RepID=A0A0C2MAR5_THEKT|nr:hypothetical protein RF11_03523 [Thelohanellus kitauei]
MIKSVARLIAYCDFLEGDLESGNCRMTSWGIQLSEWVLNCGLSVIALMCRLLSRGRQYFIVCSIREMEICLESVSDSGVESCGYLFLEPNDIVGVIKFRINENFEEAEDRIWVEFVFEDTV